MTRQQERDQFIAVLKRELAELPAHQVVRVARLLIRHAVTHGRLAEAECNGPGDYVNHIPYPRAGAIYAEHAARIERKQTQVERRIATLCAEVGIKPNFQGDPRGYTVKVHLPSGRFNTWGGAEEGYGVPQ